MDNNFLNNGGKNKFFDEEVDDDEFLRHPKSGSSGYMLPHQVGEIPGTGQTNLIFHDEGSNTVQQLSSLSPAVSGAAETAARAEEEGGGGEDLGQQ